MNFLSVFRQVGVGVSWRKLASSIRATLLKTASGRLLSRCRLSQLNTELPIRMRSDLGEKLRAVLRTLLKATWRWRRLRLVLRTANPQSFVDCLVASVLEQPSFMLFGL